MTERNHSLHISVNCRNLIQERKQNLFALVSYKMDILQWQGDTIVSNVLSRTETDEDLFTM